MCSAKNSVKPKLYACFELLLSTIKNKTKCRDQNVETLILLLLYKYEGIWLIFHENMAILDLSELIMYGWSLN